MIGDVGICLSSVSKSFLKLFSLGTNHYEFALTGAHLTMWHEGWLTFYVKFAVLFHVDMKSTKLWEWPNRKSLIFSLPMVVWCHGPVIWCRRSPVHLFIYQTWLCSCPRDPWNTDWFVVRENYSPISHSNR